MPSPRPLLVFIVAAAVTAWPALGDAKIVCWKDKAGKVVGCGDTVPPEYRDSATKELDSRGITRKTTESAEEATRRRVEAEEAAKRRAEENRRATEQKRQDAALLAAYTSEEEIDKKRDRDLQLIELQMTQVRVSLKNAAERHKEARARLEAAAKSKKGPSDALKDEIARTEKEVRRLEAALAAKDQDQDDIRARYAEHRRRFSELKAAR